MNFEQYIIDLAPEGETALFVRQKPRRDANGELQYHADGALKASWPAMLPDLSRVREGAWYGNTGSFVIDRFEQGRPSASAANVDYVLVMVLDDVGEPSKAPKASPVPPTWVMETSPGSYQWGYAFDPEDQPTKAAYSAAIRAIAEAGYSDPGAINPVRNFRLPGSVNLKPDKNGFQARLVEFHPERVYRLPDLCAALGVDLGPDDSAGVRPVRLSDDGADDVLAWLSAQGLVLSRPNPEGWAGVVCPNHADHSDGNPEGRYLGLTRAYCCYHGHCGDWDSARFLEWVAEQGGPKHTPGLRDELLTAKMAEVMSRLTPTEDYPDAAAAVVAEVERREAGRLERAEWFERYAYVADGDCYFDLIERRELTRQTFNALYRHVTCWSVHATGAKKRRVEASISYDENRQAMGARVLEGLTYAAGESIVCARDGLAFGNRWRDARPEGRSGDVSPWLAHVERLVPDAKEREHLLNVLAFKVQHPKVKVNHGILFAGVPGCGKDSLFAPFLYAIGGKDLGNVALVRNEEVTSSWGYALESEVLVVNELRQAEAKDRRALENQLKPLLAAPPEVLPVNRKYLAPYMSANRLLVIAFSNERIPIALPSDDRRWFVIWTAAPRMTEADSSALWAWYMAGGREAVAGWLRARDVSAFEPGATPMVTEAKRMMTEAGMSPVESYLLELIRGRIGEFSSGVVSAPWQELCGRLSALAPSGARVPVSALFHALAEAGWLDCGMCHSREHPTKRHLYCAPDLAELGKAELRRLSERLPGGGALRAVK